MKFTTLLDNKEALVDETIEFTCQMTQTGIEVTWLKNNQPLSFTEGRYQVVNKDCSYQLIISQVTLDDGGEYTVKAGELQSTAVLIVNGQYENKIDKDIHALSVQTHIFFF